MLGPCLEYPCFKTSYGSQIIKDDFNGPKVYIKGVGLIINPVIDHARAMFRSFISYVWDISASRLVRVPKLSMLTSLDQDKRAMDFHIF